MPAAMTETHFWELVDKRGPDECWPWLGSTDKDGYGQLRWSSKYGRKSLKAHRIAYELAHGPIPTGKVIMHFCDNPPCINDNHHILGTQADNQRDMSVKGRNHNTVKTHCRNGHEYSIDNIYRRSDNGGRKCKICHNTAVRRSAMRKIQ